MSVTPQNHASSPGERRTGRPGGWFGGQWGQNGVGELERKRPQKLFRIGEIVEFFGVSRQTIHNYTIMGLLRESDRTRGGHRLYDESVFDRLEAIYRLKQKKHSLDFIRKYFARLENPQSMEANP